MTQTRHIQKTLSPSEMQQIANSFFPCENTSKVNITKKELNDCTRLYRERIAALDKICERGGLVVVISENSEITTYPLNSYRR